MSQREEILSELFGATYERILSQNLVERGKQESDVFQDHSRRNVVRSGMYVAAQCKVQTEGIRRLFFGFIEELGRLYKENGKYEPEFFWGKCREFVSARVEAQINSSKATLKSKLKTTGGMGTTEENIIERDFGQKTLTLRAAIDQYIKEHRLKAVFLTTKSREERKALGVPDIAVMMWFPERNTPEFETAAKRFELIKSIAAELSNGGCIVKKLDDPDVVPGDQITPSVEVWLQRAAIVICDFTGCRGNVYYEFGYARACETDLLCLCPTSEISVLPSHVKGYQMTTFGDLEELKPQLKAKLETLMAANDLLGS